MKADKPVQLSLLSVKAAEDTPTGKAMCPSYTTANSIEDKIMNKTNLFMKKIIIIRK